MGEAWEPSKSQCYSVNNGRKYMHVHFNPQSGQMGRPKADGTKSQVTNWDPPQDELADRHSVVTGL